MKVNSNILWTKIFVATLSQLGVKHCCISPGSRSTPLTIAFAKNNKIKKHVIVDERTSAFFALGLAKKSVNPVALVCTSGTASTEFYSSIVEAFQSRVPLIVCTADRPPELQNCGSNQTINQDNIYKNHIRYFKDVGIPEISINGILHLKNIAAMAFSKSKMGPVHLNFPFREPLGPEINNLEIKDELLEQINNVQINITAGKDELKINKISLSEVIKFIKASKKGLIIIGPNNYNKKFISECLSLSKKFYIPILAEAGSQFRFNIQAENVITNFDSFFRIETIRKNIEPDFIIYFGRTAVSKGVEIYLRDTNAKIFIINEFGDLFVPHNKRKKIIKIEPTYFCQELNRSIDKNISSNKNSWLDKFINLDIAIEQLKNKFIYEQELNSECSIAQELISNIPNKSNLFVSNSLPIRDLESFTSKNKKSIKLYFNRGASGIDGITSTALGVASLSSKPTFLLTGDLSFYYDLSSLIYAKNFQIPLIVILVNNNGGGIFNVLNIERSRKIVEKYFITSLNLNFKDILKAFSLKHFSVSDKKELKRIINFAVKEKYFCVIEIKTDSKKSVELKKSFLKKISEMT